MPKASTRKAKANRPSPIAKPEVPEVTEKPTKTAKTSKKPTGRKSQPIKSKNNKLEKVFGQASEVEELKGLISMKQGPSVEVTFYALFPFAARAALRLSTQVLGLLTVGGFLYMFAAASYAGAHPHSLIATWVCRPPVYYLPQFLLGMTLAVALKRGFRLRIHPAVPIALLLAYDIAYYKLRAHASPVTRSLLDHTLLITISILAGLIIVAFVQREIAGRKGLLSKRPAMLLGAWSYCFYLLHHSVSRLATYQWGHQPAVTSSKTNAPPGIRTRATSSSGDASRGCAGLTAKSNAAS